MITRRVLLISLLFGIGNLLCVNFIRHLFQWEPIAGGIGLIVYLVLVIYFPFRIFKAPKK